MPIWKTKTFVEIIFHIRFQIDQRKAFKRLKRFHVKPRTTEQIVDWALNAGTRGEFEISTMQIRDEILSLANTVAELQPKVILDRYCLRGDAIHLVPARFRTRYNLRFI